MTTVLLVRHGRTHANAGGVLAGRAEGVGLDDEGCGQARALGTRLQPLQLDAVVVSPLQRTRETADLLLGDRSVPRHEDERVVECDYGDWTGRSLKELAREPLWKVVQSHPSAAAFPAGESLAGMQHRAVSAVREWNASLGDDAVYAVVSHGDVIKAILADALGMHLDQFQRIRVDPASLSVIQFTPLRPFVERMNDTSGDVNLLRPKRTRRRRRSSDAAVGGGSGA